MRSILVLLCALLVTGCASLGGNTMKVAADDGSKKELSVDPISFIGVQWTDNVSEGRFKAYLATFPQELFAEFHPLRVRYNAVAYGESSGKEYPAQALYAGYAQCALRLTIIVEGSPNEPIVGAIATTRYTKMFSLSGDSISVKTPEKLATDASYRKEVVVSGGTAVKRLKGIPVLGQDGLQAMFRDWNTVRVKGLTDQRTPLAEKFVKLVARDNPETSFQEKLVGNGTFAVTPSWFGVAMGAAQDVFAAATAPEKGWDEKSELKREYQGMIAQVIASQYQAAIDAGMICPKMAK